MKHGTATSSMYDGRQHRHAPHGEQHHRRHRFCCGGTNLEDYLLVRRQIGEYVHGQGTAMLAFHIGRSCTFRGSCANLGLLEGVGCHTKNISEPQLPPQNDV